MTNETLYNLLLLSPLMIGGIIAIINSEEVNNTTEKAEAWTRSNQANVALKSGWFSRYLANPVLWIIVKFSDWTDDFVHRGLKNGLRVAATIYLIGFWCYLLFFAFVMIAALIIGVVIIYIILKVVFNSNDDSSQSFEKGRRIVGSAGPNQRVNPNTGRIEENGFLGWNETNQRIDPETGNIQKKGMFGWDDTGTRIDQDTGNIQKEGFWSYTDTNTRINPETGAIQKNGFLGWEDTNERIDPETGRRQKSGMFGWQDE